MSSSRRRTTREGRIRRVGADTVRGAQREVIASLPDQLERDVLALRAAGVEPVTPLLHDRVIGAALRLDGDLLVDGETRTVALRAAAAGTLADEMAYLDKKAAQYGSLAARELDRLARQAGCKRRMDDTLPSTSNRSSSEPRLRLADGFDCSLADLDDIAGSSSLRACNSSAENHSQSSAGVRPAVGIDVARFDRRVVDVVDVLVADGAVVVNVDVVEQVMLWLGHRRPVALSMSCCGR